MTDEYSVHNEPDFARVYDEDDMLTIRKGDLRALLDMVTGSMDYGSGFLNNEDIEILRKAARVLGINPDEVTPTQHVCQYRGTHQWVKNPWKRRDPPQTGDWWYCKDCRRQTLTDPTVHP